MKGRRRDVTILDGDGGDVEKGAYSGNGNGLGDSSEGMSSDGVEEIRRVLEREIDGLCSKYEGIDVGLSGGVDSSTLVCLLARRGVRPRVWMLGDGCQDEGEERHAEAILRRYDLEAHRVVVELSQLPGAFEEAVRLMEGPVINARAVAKTLFFRAVADEGGDVFVSGVGADDLLAGKPEAFGLNAEGQPGFVASRVPAKKVERLILREKSVRETKFDGRELDFWGLRKLRFECVTRPLVLPMEVGAPESMELRVCTPFLSLAMYEVARGLGREALIAGDYGKVALRKAVEPWVGEEVAWQPKVPVYAPAGGGSEELRRRWADLFEGLLTKHRLGPFERVCPDAVKSLVDEYRCLDLSSQKLRILEQVLMRLASLVILVRQPGGSGRWLESYL